MRANLNNANFNCLKQTSVYCFKLGFKYMKTTGWQSCCRRECMLIDFDVLRIYLRQPEKLLERMEDIKSSQTLLWDTRLTLIELQIIYLSLFTFEYLQTVSIMVIITILNGVLVCGFIFVIFLYMTSPMTCLSYSFESSCEDLLDDV